MPSAAEILAAAPPAGGNPAGAPAPADSTSAAGGAPAAPPANDNGAGAPAARVEWLGDAAEDLHAFAAANGYKAPGDVVANVRDLQKFLGADKAGRGLVLPKDADDADGWGAVYDKLGRPANAEAYAFLKAEGVDPAFAKAAAETFHGAGVTEKQASALVEWWGKSVEAGKAAEDAAFLEASGAAHDELMKEWGSAAEGNKELARRGAQLFGFSAEELDKVERAIGTKAVFERFLAVGKGLAEDTLPKGAAGRPGAPSPAAAQEQIAAKMADPAYAARVRKGEPTAKKEMEALYRAAYPS